MPVCDGCNQGAAVVALCDTATVDEHGNPEPGRLCRDCWPDHWDWPYGDSTMTEQQESDTETWTYTFDSDLAEPILDGDKRATIRYRDGRRPVPGDEIEAVLPDGSQFAALDVTGVLSTSVEGAVGVLEALDAGHGCDSTNELLHRLSGYYPGERIDRLTPVRIVLFEPLLGWSP